MSRCHLKPYRTKHQAQIAIVTAVLLLNTGQGYKKPGDKPPVNLIWHQSCHAYHITPSQTRRAS